MNPEPVGTHRRIRSSVWRSVALATAAVLLTSACAAGQVTETAEEKSTIDGTNETIGNIGLRAVAIEAPPIGSVAYQPRTAAELKIVLVNSGRTLDTLNSITTPAARGWANFADYADAFDVQEARLAAIGGSSSAAAASDDVTAPGSGVGTPSGPGTLPGEASPSSGPSAGAVNPTPGASVSSNDSPAPSAPAPLQKGTQTVLVPPGGRVSFGTPEATGAILLLPITDTLYPGTSVQITFGFTNAGSITVAVPVQLAGDPRTVEVGDPAGASDGP